VSHGVVASPALEIARFFDALFHERLISAESLHEMTTLVPVPINPSPEDRARKPGYGLGLMGDPESPWCNGRRRGFHCRARRLRPAWFVRAGRL